jgi:hypothetical protein
MKAETNQSVLDINVLRTYIPPDYDNLVILRLSNLQYSELI